MHGDVTIDGDVVLPSSKHTDRNDVAKLCLVLSDICQLYINVSSTCQTDHTCSGNIQHPT